MTWAVWFSLLAVCTLGAMAPGPSLAMVVRHTLNGGKLHGVICAWAHALGIGIYALLTLLGLSVVLASMPAVFKGITVCGALYLAWLGLQSFLARGGVMQQLKTTKSTSLWKAARDGFAISLLNPKIAIFFIALFSQFVSAATSELGQSIIVLTPLVVDGLWYTLISLLLSHPLLLPKLREKSSLIDKLSGGVLIILALRVVTTL